MAHSLILGDALIYLLKIYANLQTATSSGDIKNFSLYLVIFIDNAKPRCYNRDNRRIAGKNCVGGRENVWCNQKRWGKIGF